MVCSALSALHDALALPAQPGKAQPGKAIADQAVAYMHKFIVQTLKLHLQCRPHVWRPLTPEAARCH